MDAWQDIKNNLQGERHSFLVAAGSAEETQQQLLSAILQRHQHTAFGKEQGFSAAHDPVAFIQSLPVSDYSGLKPWIDATATTDPNALIADLSHFELTGGSQGGAKLIPYGASGMGAFQSALFPWMEDLLQHRPGISRGHAYWSISPAVPVADSSSAGIPIGLGNDALYFGEQLAASISRTLAVSMQAASYKAYSDWQLYTLTQLLLSEDLSFISVWSPSFLCMLVKGLHSQFHRLMQQLPGASARRLKQAVGEGEVDTQQLWPQLDTISCWTQGASQQFIPELQQLFPQANIQGKGLLATEAVVSLPLYQASDPVLAINSGYFEFRAQSGELCSLTGVKQGQTYEVIVTNDLGMYRYAMGDLVEVTGWYEQVPCLGFVGRKNSSDLVGEKLHEAFVSRILMNEPGYSLLCAHSSSQPHYRLLADSQAVDVQRVEQKLRENPQYDYARRMGQLSQLRFEYVPGLMDCFQQWRQQQGQVLGDIKPMPLLPDDQFLKFIQRRK